MQWDCSANAGFTTASEPWMVVNKHTKWNVESKFGDPGSVMRYWKDIIALRKEMAPFCLWVLCCPCGGRDRGDGAWV